MVDIVKLIEEATGKKVKFFQIIYEGDEEYDPEIAGDEEE
jgi:hypothetical protein